MYEIYTKICIFVKIVIQIGMKSIKELYKIGNGPSSSHTMGPKKAALIFKDKCPQAESFRVTLYGSLGATGKGHLTDKAIIDALAPKQTEIVWKGDVVLDFHTNGMLYEGLDSEGKVLDSWTVYSVGGGAISEGPDDNLATPDVYEHNTMDEIKEFLNANGLSYWEYVYQREAPDFKDYLMTVWNQMRETVEQGLKDDSVLPGSLHMRSKARQYYARATGSREFIAARLYLMSYALATSEMNARGGVVVTAPTCGSCGVVPAVLYGVYQYRQIPDDDICKALATAGLFGNVIKQNASVSGAEVGCQGEVGSACVMAATAVCQIFGGTTRQIECAGEIAMEHNLGLTCDPVCGLVQVPCIDRNAMAAARALDSGMYAISGDGSSMVSFDAVVATMKQTGHDIPSPYKETAMGGLATLSGLASE